MRRTLRTGPLTVELLNRPGPSADVIRFSDLGAAGAFVRRLAGHAENLSTLRGFLSAELSVPAVDRLTDAEIVGLIARHALARRIGFVQRAAKPLWSRDLGESAVEAPVAAAPPKQEKTWIEIVLRDMEGNPVPNERYWIRLTDGTIREGRLNSKGRAYFDGLDPGECDVRFPDLDVEATARTAGGAKRARAEYLLDLPPEEPVPAPAPAPEKTWIEIVLRDMTGNPVPWAPYRIKLTDGTIEEGLLDAEGRAYFGDLDPGNCLVSFPDLDAEATARDPGGASRAGWVSAPLDAAAFEAGDRASGAAAPEKTWIDLILVDADEKPMPGERYRITLPGGDVREGTLDAQGRAHLDGLDPGDCEISFPDHDGAMIEAVP
ncbi:Hypothetical protein A7982_05592 [Minicystis rosea]|nr:Hypothetical protein A7982_05592 [Minicystis rosea]